jgi:Fe-S-cluster containining protein
MESNLFEKELQEWMKNTLNPYCLNECKISCCDCEGAIQIDKGYEHLFETYKLTGEKVSITKKTRGLPHLFKSKHNGLWYFWGRACPNYDPKNKKCLIHNQYPRCALYPLIKIGKTGDKYVLSYVCGLHKLKENQEPLKSLIQLCKKHNVKLSKQKI